MYELLLEKMLKYPPPRGMSAFRTVRSARPSPRCLPGALRSSRALLTEPAVLRVHDAWIADALGPPFCGVFRYPCMHVSCDWSMCT